MPTKTTNSIAANTAALSKIAAAISVCVLTACGGGGGSSPASTASAGGATSGTSSAAGTPQTVTPPTPAIDPLAASAVGSQRTSLPANLAYPSERAKQLIESINAIRVKSGAGLALINSNLNTAAQKHAEYLSLNQIEASHNEDSTKPGFYGETPIDRAKKSGYAYSIAHEGVVAPSKSSPDQCHDFFLNSVYHAFSLLSIFSDIGIGLADFPGNRETCVLAYGHRFSPTFFSKTVDYSIKDGQILGGKDLVTYPYPGQTNAHYQFCVQCESPRPPVSQLPNQFAGSPVNVGLENAEFINLLRMGKAALQITEFALLDETGNKVPAVVLIPSSATASSSVGAFVDPSMQRPTFVSLVPKSELLPGKKYSVTFKANLSANGPQVEKAWSFATKK